MSATMSPAMARFDEVERKSFEHLADGISA
jgi:hypothetical protein